VLYSDTGATDTTVTITGGSLHAAGDLIVSAGGKTNLVFSRVVISPPGSGHAIHFTGTGGEVDLMPEPDSPLREHCGGGCVLA